MSSLPPTQVFVCDVCGARAETKFDPTVPAYVRAGAHQMLIGAHQYEVCKTCIRAVWQHLGFLRGMGACALPLGATRSLPYLVTYNAEQSDLDDRVCSSLTDKKT